MTRSITISLATLFMLAFSAGVHAQCAGNETEITVNITTDQYGYETYWEIKDADNGTVYGSGGNALVPPGGQQGASSGDPNAYGANDNSISETVCVPNNSSLTFIIYDDYGDGMCCAYGNGSYEVVIDGITVAEGGSFSVSEATSFVAPIPSLDASLVNVTSSTLVTPGDYTIEGTIKNIGSTALNSFDVMFELDGDTRYATVSGLNIAAFETGSFSLNVPACVPDTGSLPLDITVDNLNGTQADPSPANNTQSLTLTSVMSYVERLVLSEHFTQASCGPCAAQNPVYTALLENNPGLVASIKYHTSWPGVDPMYDFAPTGADARVNYYNVSGVPNLQMEGSVWSGSPASVSLEQIKGWKAVPSDVKIELNETKSGNDITVSATVTAMADLTDYSQVKIRIAIVEDLVEYASAPGSNGETSFPQVFRGFVGGATGTAWGTLSEGGTQTASGTYTIDPSEIDPAELRTVVFVQSDADKSILQAFMTSVPSGTSTESTASYQSSTCTEINTAIANPTADSDNIKVYPNPTNGVVNVAVNLNSDDDVWVTMTNTLGQVVKSRNLAQVNGNRNIQFDVADLSTGIYILNVHANGQLHTQKVSVTK